MKPFDHSEFEHERRAFALLEKLLPQSDHYELYPSIYITDPRRRMYECDALFISESFAAVIELKDWVGNIEVTSNSWFRSKQAVPNPHNVNLPKTKVFKSLIATQLPAVRAPFVQSVVVLTSERSSIDGADSAFEIIRELNQNNRLSDHLTFVGMEELAKYLKERVKRDLASGRSVLNTQNFRKLRKFWDEYFEIGCRRDDYSDQVPGFRILSEFEHNDRYVSYLAEANPKRGDALFRLRVFGFVAETATEQARQYRSLDAIQTLAPHPNIRSVYSHPNEKGLVVEVCPWGDVNTLDKILETNDKVSLNFTVRIIRDVADALAYIHESEASLIHRNVSPRSIVIGRDDHVELTDFDFVFDPSATHTVMGTPLTDYEKRYGSPEALIGNADYGSDVYSLGQIFRELLAKVEEIDEELTTLCQAMVLSDLAMRPSARTVTTRLNTWLGESRGNVKDAPLQAEIKEPQVGDEHDTWTLKKKLGSGGTSEVFLGDSHGDLATLKIFKSDVPRERCLAERDFLRTSKSQFVANYRGFLQWNGLYWCIAEEYVEGITLKELISKGKRPSLEEFIAVASQILRALSDLHESKQGEFEDGVINAVTHNDVTPGNIVYNPEKQLAKLVDFGLACYSGQKVYGGTPGYAAKELITKEGYLASPVGDIFSLAVTLLEWYTGERYNSADAVPPIFRERKESEKLTQIIRSMLDLQKKPSVSSSSLLDTLTDLKCEEDKNVPANKIEPSKTDIKPSEVQALKQEPVSVNVSPKVGSQGADEYVRYLNSIHNLSADNRYALAEAQAISPYFTELHVEVDLVSSINDLLTSQGDVIVILTGHAGDGKSTVALDIWKRALGVPHNEPAPKSPGEEEKVFLGGHNVTIVKDMSELSAQSRGEKLNTAFSEPGSALIVSNTGPLLSSFTELLTKNGHEQREAQQQVLECLNKPLLKDRLSDTNLLQLSGKKRVYVANLSMLSNVNTVERLLSKLASHSGWTACSGCEARDRCPIQRNVEVISQCAGIIGERVGDIYRRLDAYGRRMTLRQIAAHLSFSLTGGLSCEQVRQDPQTKFRGVFSETFFGHGSQLRLQAVEALSCLRQMSDLHFGITSSPNFDQQLHEGKLDAAWNYPAQLNELKAYFVSRLSSSNGGSARRKIRRLTYMFGMSREAYQDSAEVFFDDFLQSPMLRQLRTWSVEKSLSGMEKQRFLKQVLGVLLEEYIGASVPRNKRDGLIITLRRPDERVFQSVQIVLGRISFDEFTIDLDEVTGLPMLKHSVSKARLELTLPLLDYIICKDQGELTSDLDAIHGASLEQFRSDLLEHIQPSGDNVKLLEIDAQGDLLTHKFTPIDRGHKLVYQ